MATVPLGFRLLPGVSNNSTRDTRYKIFILVFTFFVYTSYHCSRKPISIVKNELHKNCTVLGINDTSCDWKPFDHANFKELLGSLDYAYLFAYAIGMFLSGHIAERMNLRYFLTAGMISSGVMTIAFGLGYFWGIHSFAYYIVVQILCGLVQASGWPSVVATVGNWWGKGKRGLIMGVWNCHTSVGNILGSVIAGVFVSTAWGWSFIIPGLIITFMGVLVFFFHVPKPSDVGCSDPDQNGQAAPMTDETHQECHPQYESVTYPQSKEADIEHSLANPTQSIEDPNVQDSTALVPTGEEKAVSFWKALLVPGVIEYSLCLFFAKLVSYTFLYWLPNYIKYSAKLSNTKSADLSTVFDFGGATGGILAGLLSDYTGGRASTCALLLVLAAPMMYIYNLYGAVSIETNIILLFITGMLVNGPYALITTAVSADLGTHKSLRGSTHALATVTAIIDGTGSMGAALGPLLCGMITVWRDVFYMLIAADICALLFLIRRVRKEVLIILAAKRLKFSS